MSKLVDQLLNEASDPIAGLVADIRATFGINVTVEQIDPYKYNVVPVGPGRLPRNKSRWNDITWPDETAVVEEVQPSPDGSVFVILC